MEANIVKILDVPGENVQVVVYRTSTSQFSFAKRWWDNKLGEYGELGPACGLYDSAETAEREARLRTVGLTPLPDKDSFH